MRSLAFFSSVGFLAAATVCSAADRPAAKSPAPGKSPRIVVTGFGPFAGRPVNASSLLAKAIAARHPEWSVRAVEIPVIWGQPEQVLKSVSVQPWDLWIAFGEGGPGAFSIETKADNERGGSQDNNHQGPPAPMIKDGGPAQLSLAADARQLAHRIAELGYAARVSSSAGHYLCEEMLYTLLHAQQQEAQRRVLFIHVPPYGQPLKTTGGPDSVPVVFDDATIDRVADMVAPALVEFLSESKP